MLILLPYLLLSALWLFPEPAISGEAVAVIVNKSNHISEMSLKKLARVYRGQLTKWESGESIIVLNRKVDSSIRERFYRIVLDSSPLKRFFRPDSPVPFRTRSLSSSRATVRYVSKIPTAIGYVLVSEADDSVKVLRIDKRKPEEEEYPLKRK